MGNQSEHVWICRVCGLRTTAETPEQMPWTPEGSANYLICECCGIESGYEDDSPATARRARAEWLSRGAPWFVPKYRPADWDLQEQLAKIPADYL